MAREAYVVGEDAWQGVTVADGTHPAGMHSCSTQFWSRQTQRLYSSDAPETVIETLLLFCFKVYMIYFLTVFLLVTSVANK